MEPRRRVMVAGLVVTGVAVALAFVRGPEPPALDQSLFGYYGERLLAGDRLYRDLWDSKPPALFVLYAGAARLVGGAHAAWFLGQLALLAGMALVARLVLAVSPAATRSAWIAACLAAVALRLLAEAPVFGPQAMGQAEMLGIPLVLAACLRARSPHRRSMVEAGFLVGLAALLKLVWLAMLPLPLVVAPGARGQRLRARLAGGAGLLAGCAAALGIAALALAVQGTLEEAVRAVVLYPRAYAAEIAARLPLDRAAWHGAAKLLESLPWTLGIAAYGAWRGIGALRRLGLVWVALGALAAVAQRQMAGYHLLLLAPPLALLAGRGLVALAGDLQALARRTQRLELRASAAFVMLCALLAAGGMQEGRGWWRAYGARFTDPAHPDPAARVPAWEAARPVARAIRAAARPGDRLLVWGLAPAVYLQAALPPATRYAFHQTLLVPGSALGMRWGDTPARLRAFLQEFEAAPPRFVVVARRDRNGFEPQSSEAELDAVPELRHLLQRDYMSALVTPDYVLWVRRPAAGAGGAS